MKALALTHLKTVDIIEVPFPQRKKDGDVLVKICQAGICGSDIHYFETGRIGARQVSFPFILGHECSGTVVEIGPAVRRVKAGDAVAVDPAISCGHCDQCIKGRRHTCRSLTFLGCPDEAQGCMSEYIVMPESCLYPLSNTLTLQEGVICEPLSIGIYSVKLAALKTGDNIAILGSGPIGLSVLSVLRHQGIGKIIATDILDYRVVIAKKAGAAWTGNPFRISVESAVSDLMPLGVDVVFECAGQQKALDQAIDLLMPGGKLIVIGIPREERISLPIDLVRRKEITIINVRRQNECVEEAVSMLAQKQFPTDLFISHSFGLSDSQKAFDMVSRYDSGVMKALIQI